MDHVVDLTPDVRDAILGWYAAHGRTLAFRRTTDPYAVLVSEVIAQQTQAERAAARWECFMARFPTVEALAAATPAEVLREWQGLGYDRRGLRLWRTARLIRDEHAGCVPDSVELLEALPGVGPYTARAVAAIAFGHPVGAVDVNVRRVLGRLLAGDAAVATPVIQPIADRAAAATDPGQWTHALMDLGATVCRPRNPRCADCPVVASCRYAVTIQPTAPPARAAHKGDRTPFPSTNRWLRGRILDRLRAAPDGGWVVLDEPIGVHALDRVHQAAGGLAEDGLVELDRSMPATLHARLTTA